MKAKKYQTLEEARVALLKLVKKWIADNKNVTQQVEGLNKLVMNYSVPQIIGEAEGYVKFKNDVSTMAMPMDRPTSTYSSNTLELKPWF